MCGPYTCRMNTVGGPSIYSLLVPTTDGGLFPGVGTADFVEPLSSARYKISSRFCFFWKRSCLPKVNLKRVAQIRLVVSTYFLGRASTDCDMLAGSYAAALVEAL